MAGIFLWLMGWRLLQAGADRAPLPILALGVAVTLATAGLEYIWFALATKVPPLRPLLAELDWHFGPHPAGQVLILGGCVTVATALAWAGQRERLSARAAYHGALYAGGAAIVLAIAYAFALTDSWLPDNWTLWQGGGVFIACAAVLGLIRWALPKGRPIMDGIGLVVLLTPLLAGVTL